MERIFYDTLCVYRGFLMKKEAFIQKVLNHKLNTLFVDREQVERALEIFEGLGMKPPSATGEFSKALTDIYIYPDYNQWDDDLDKDKKVIDYLNRLR
jgi:hypothetical protein